MKGFSATVKQDTMPDKTARLELENGEVITVYDGKRRLENAEGERYNFKCIATVGSMIVENQGIDIDDEDGIRREKEKAETISVVGRVTSKNARTGWMNSEGRKLTEVDTGMGQVALKQNGTLTVNDYRISVGDRVKALCNHFTIIDVEELV